MNRVVIIGNSGSGKSTLAKELGARRALPIVHLDKLFWADGSYSEKRPTDVVRAEIDRRKAESEWIMEGVFGELAERLLDRADYLIWLNLPWSICRSGLEMRGTSRNDDSGKVLFAALIVWAENYWTRTDLRSAVGHGQIFSGFPGEKAQITQRDQLKPLLENIRGKLP